MSKTNSNNEFKKSAKNTFTSPIMLVIGIVLICYVVFLISLLLWGFFTSVKAGLGVPGLFNKFWGNETGLPQGAPWEWQWSNYPTVLEYIKVTRNVYVSGGVKVGTITSRFGDMFANTMFYTFGGAAVSTLVPCIVAYATTKTNFKFSKIYDAIILIVMVIPIVGAQPSQIQMLYTLGIYDTWLGYYIQIAHTISVYYLIFQAIFRSIPYTYNEAAYIEGAGEFTVMFKVVMPLAFSIIMTVFLIHFITIWNDYNTSLIYMPTHPSLAYGIFNLVILNGENAINDIVYKTAGSFMLFSPILILFICFRKVLMQNLSMGGLKE